MAGQGSRSASPTSPKHRALRTEWAQASPDQLYSSTADVTKPAPARTVFGTSKREGEDKKYIAAAFTSPPTYVPGPGLYRQHTSDANPNGITMPSAPGFAFGTSPQRVDPVSTSSAPGPIYALPEPRTNITTSFAVFGSHPDLTFSQGLAASGMSSLKSTFGRPATVCTDSPGPAAYDIGRLEAVSAVTRAPAYSFPSTDRDSKKGPIFQSQIVSDPAYGTCMETPGYIYDPHKPQSIPNTKFGSSPQRYSPEKGGNCGGPLVSKQHMEVGTDSPGPACYSPASPTSNRASFWFPATSAEGKAAQMVPGPGAYTPHMESLARIPSSPCFTLGPRDLRIDVGAGNCSPGSAAYSLPSPDKESGRMTAPAFSLGRSPTGGRGMINSAAAETPGPNAYNRLDYAIQTGPRRGYSFGTRERTVHAKSTISVRCYGPLASLEAAGMDSPGPGVYNVRSGSKAAANAPSLKFDHAPRDAAPMLYFSKEHAALDHCGMDSPGPGAYDTSKGSNSSKYSKRMAGRWGSGQRFNGSLTF